ncbi:MAG: pilus assembly protein [Pseudomonadota bacterium]
MLFKRGVGQFARNRSGATAIIFACCLFPMILVIGFVVDFGLHHNYSSKVQRALDMAGLAAARHLNQNLGADVDDVERIAQDYFDAELDDAAYLSLNDVSVERIGMRISLDVDGTMPTSFMHLAGVTKMPLNTETEVAYGVPTEAEIVLVLDTSTSMSLTEVGSGVSRIESLKIAAKDMVSTLLDASSTVDIKIGIIPFSNRVNIGTDQASAPWLSVPADEIRDLEDCRIRDDWYEANCKKTYVNCDSDDVENLCGTWNCDDVDMSTAKKECTTYQKTWTWYGCVKPRSSASHLRDGRYGLEKIPGILSTNDWQCASPVRHLTDQVSDLNLTIDRLRVRNETYIPSGLMWGYRMLTKRKPFQSDESIGDFMTGGGIKTIVLMSDGANTLAPTPHGKITDSDSDLPGPTVEELANDNTKEICDRMKGDGVEVYVVAYDITDTETTDLLEDCASTESRFYSAESTDELKAVFEAIAKQIARDISIVG